MVGSCAFCLSNIFNSTQQVFMKCLLFNWHHVGDVIRIYVKCDTCFLSSRSLPIWSCHSFLNPSELPLALKKIIIIGVMMTDNIDRANSVCQELCPVFYICHRLNPHKSLGGNVIIPVLQIRKLKLREIKWHVQGYIASKWQRKFELVLLSKDIMPFIMARKSPCGLARTSSLALLGSYISRSAMLNYL